MKDVSILWRKSKDDPHLTIGSDTIVGEKKRKRKKERPKNCEVGELESTHTCDRDSTSS